jgi:hypothetical protein
VYASTIIRNSEYQYITAELIDAVIVQLCGVYFDAESKRIEQAGGYMFTQTTVPASFNFGGGAI